MTAWKSSPAWLVAWVLFAAILMVLAAQLHSVRTDIGHGHGKPCKSCH